VLFTTALAVIVVMAAWTIVLFYRGQLARLEAPAPDERLTNRFLWVFLVPALNEEVTIRDSVSRLLAVRAPRKRILVIDDGSDDRTPEELAALQREHPELHVLRRDTPNARIGKAAALNNAYRELGGVLEAEGASREEAVVCVVDADGRLDPDAPSYVAAHLADEGIGSVQCLVRIYNRNRFLTWMQDVEFSIYGCLFQAGRNRGGTAGMGGNGQFNRVRALDAIADDIGPWRDRLTEDQDLGLRLIVAGWGSHQDLRATVSQQGLFSLRKLFRQRTRWSQGNLQAMALIGSIWRSRVRLADRLDLIAYLLMPVWQSLIGAALVGAVVLVATGDAQIVPRGSPWLLVFFYLLGFGSTMMGCVAAQMGGDRRGGVLMGLGVAQVYAFYSWLLWPVLIRAAARQLTSRRGWAKTEREALAGSSTR
jgi:1,2-diacylglycerol 3-beta-glucosyltransferase